ncbi:uncharacterized protein LOC122663369 [Telopea speciosissima]|uniref:uncharacterized protein LOC122663369 n=1 Tax=Telopea speciosissima TaxID=54955 RepID=UPI001CC697D6|nr:uncharacterized protein LOC122663369 [Telopea speciosissima]
MDEPTDMYDLYSRCEKHINLAEVLAAEQQKETRNEKKGLDRKEHTNNRNRTMENREQSMGKRKREEHVWVLRNDLKVESSYTSLMHRRAYILNEIKDRLTLRWPTKMVKPASERNKNKYCRFHQDHGHDIEECRQLKDEIEALIQRGRLNKFVKRERGESSKQESRGQKEEDKGKMSTRGEGSPSIRARHSENQPIREIATIFGGPGLGGQSSNSRKNHARMVGLTETTSKKRKAEQQITFSDEDLVDIQLPHDNALVVKMIVTNCSVARILVDNGSFVNILYYDAFLKMQLTPEMLKKIDSPLYEFNGAPV